MKRRVLVTGSNKGIGKATAGKLAENGFSVVLHGHSDLQALNETHETLQQQGYDVTALRFDIADRQACHEILTEDMARYGAYYGVVCNAGVTRDDAFPAISGENWDAVLHTNLDGFYNVLKPVIMPMIQLRSGGRIVTLSSVSGLMGNRGQVNYSAAKAGIIGATKALAIELAKRKITVNCVAPGVIETDMMNAVAVEEALKLVPVKRLGKPEEVASLIGYLFSDEAAYITRQVISVNGGMI